MKLKFFYRNNCHLCEDMYQLLHPYLSNYTIEIIMLNVDKEVILKEKYGHLVPVLTDDNENEICHYFFDKAGFEQFLKNNTNSR